MEIRKADKSSGEEPRRSGTDLNQTRWKNLCVRGFWVHHCVIPVSQSYVRFDHATIAIAVDLAARSFRSWSSARGVVPAQNTTVNSHDRLASELPARYGSSEEN